MQQFYHCTTGTRICHLHTLFFSNIFQSYLIFPTFVHLFIYYKEEPDWFSHSQDSHWLSFEPRSQGVQRLHSSCQKHKGWPRARLHPCKLFKVYPQSQSLSFHPFFLMNSVVNFVFANVTTQWPNVLENLHISPFLVILDVQFNESVYER